MGIWRSRLDLLSAGVAGEQGDSPRAETGPGAGAELVSIQTFSSS
jgi:hypothetical protein